MKQARNTSSAVKLTADEAFLKYVSGSLLHPTRRSKIKIIHLFLLQCWILGGLNLARAGKGYVILFSLNVSLMKAKRSDNELLSIVKQLHSRPRVRNSTQYLKFDLAEKIAQCSSTSIFVTEMIDFSLRLDPNKSEYKTAKGRTPTGGSKLARFVVRQSPSYISRLPPPKTVTSSRRKNGGYAEGAADKFWSQHKKTAPFLYACKLMPEFRIRYPIKGIATLVADQNKIIRFFRTYNEIARRLAAISSDYKYPIIDMGEAGDKPVRLKLAPLEEDVIEKIREYTSA